MRHDRVGWAGLGEVMCCLLVCTNAVFATHGAATSVLVINETDASNVCASPVCQTLIPEKVGWEGGVEWAA
jgi:hypothetical protein